MQIQKGKKFITVQDGDNLTRYFEEIRKYEPLTKEQERVLIIKIQKGNDKQALDQLVKANIRFVVSIAKKYQGQGVPLLDLISEGNSGLLEAVQRFDAKQDLKFFSYAVWWIRQRIFTKMDYNKRIVRLPDNRFLLVQRVKKEILLLEGKLSRYPTMEELIKQMNNEYTKEDLNEAILHGGRVKSINETIGDDEEGETLEESTKGDLDIDDTDRLESIATDLNRFLHHLTQYEYDVMVLSLGLNGEPALRHASVAKALSLNEKDIANIKIRAVKRIRKVKNVELLRGYL